jgi:dUTPase
MKPYGLKYDEFVQATDDRPTFKFAILPEIADLGVDFLPFRTHYSDTGWDVKCAEHKGITLRAGQYAKISLGFRVFSPPGYWLELRPRSSSFAKKQLHALYGVIDQGWEGPCLFACQYLPDINSMGKDLVINFGEAIGQLVPMERQEMKVELISNEQYDELCKARAGTRKDGGFGSTSQ